MTKVKLLNFFSRLGCKFACLAHKPFVALSRASVYYVKSIFASQVQCCTE